MFIVFARIGALLAALTVVGASVRGQSNFGDPAIGQQIAARECAGCHGVGTARGVTVQGVYVPSFGEIARRPHRTRERLQSLVLIPNHPMPGIPLSESEVRHVVEYILSLQH